jgi:hypothetical protein
MLVPHPSRLWESGEELVGCRRDGGDDAESVATEGPDKAVVAEPIECLGEVGAPAEWLGTA